MVEHTFVIRYIVPPKNIVPRIVRIPDQNVYSEVIRLHILYYERQ